MDLFDQEVDVAVSLVAVTVGVSAVLAGRSAISDGFGLLGIASIGPVLAVLVLALVLW